MVTQPDPRKGPVDRTPPTGRLTVVEPPGQDLCPWVEAHLMPNPTTAPQQHERRPSGWQHRPVQLLAGNRLQGTGFDSALRQGFVDGRWVLDLSKVKFVEIYPMVAMACFVSRAQQRGHGLQLSIPESNQVKTYLSRMGFVEMLAEHYEVEARPLRQVRAQPHPNDLLELQRFDSSHKIEELANLVWERLSQVPPHVRRTIYECIIEIGDNVIFHAGSGGGWVAAQTYRRGTANERIDLAIGDTGVGIRRTMRRHKPRSDGDAIRLALQFGVSGLADPGRGVGLAETADQIRSVGGRLLVRSGAGRRTVTRHSSVSTPVPALQGTVVGMSIPCA